MSHANALRNSKIRLLQSSDLCQSSVLCKFVLETTPSITISIYSMPLNILCGVCVRMFVFYFVWDFTCCCCCGGDDGGCCGCYCCCYLIVQWSGLEFFTGIEKRIRFYWQKNFHASLIKKFKKEDDFMNIENFFLLNLSTSGLGYHVPQQQQKKK